MRVTRLRKATTLLLVLATATLVPCGPALAQGSPSAAQYTVAPGDCPSNSRNVACIQSVEDGAEACAENAGQGSGAVNDAIDGTAPPASASAESSAGESAVSANADTEAGGEAVASTTRLPETGGVPGATLGLGSALVVLGLALRGIGGR